MACSEIDVRRGDLLIRTYEGDSIGDRPIENCRSFWLSPDLWVVGGPDRTTAREGVAITLQARVTNGGKQPYEDINVEAWVCDYTAGPLPTGQIDPPGRVTGFAPGPLNPGQSVVVSCAPTWIPTATQVAMNNGHLCLAANVWAETPVDGAELPAARSILPCCNTHHAQRNIALVAARSGSRVKQQMRMFAPGEEEQFPVLVEFFPVTDPRAFTRGEAELLRHSEWGRKIKRYSLGDPKSAKATLSGDDFKGEQRVELALSARKGTNVTLEVTVPRTAKPGTVLLFDAVTRNARDDDQIGGARLLIVTV